MSAASISTLSQRGEGDFNLWVEAIPALAKYATNLQNIDISLDQSFGLYYRGSCSASEFAEADEERWTEILECFDQLGKLSIRTATFIISDRDLYMRWYGHDWEMYLRLESKYHWTLEEKRAWRRMSGIRFFISKNLHWSTQAITQSNDIQG